MQDLQVFPATEMNVYTKSFVVAFHPWDELSNCSHQFFFAVSSAGQHSILSHTLKAAYKRKSFQGRGNIDRHLYHICLSMAAFFISFYTYTLKNVLHDQVKMEPSCVYKTRSNIQISFLVESRLAVSPWENFFLLKK